jgi:signal transduction histidine kinase
MVVFVDMTAPQDHDHDLSAAGGAPAALLRHKDQILESFRARVQDELRGARRETGPMIIDTLPLFLSRLALALAPDSELDFASEFSNIAIQHGNERARLTHYRLADVVREYQILREVILHALRTEPDISPQHWQLIHRSLDEAVAESSSAFVRAHQDLRELFVAALSHDFRGPLSNASNYLELLLRDADPARRAHFATRALTNLRQIDRMIRDLLDVVRANARDGLAVRLEPCAALKIVNEVVNDLRANRADNFVIDAATDIHGYWDCERLKQALHNLLENAQKYGRHGAPITVRLHEMKGRLMISVHNHGDPIPPDLLPVLFQPFRRLPNAEGGTQAGWGLGLVLVEAIAEAHGGSVAVESTPDLGTTFTIDILCDPREWRREREAA